MDLKKNKKISMTLFTTAIILLSVLSIVPKTLADEPDSIIINEIMYNPEGTDSGYEWIEIFNTLDQDINITGWMLYESGTNHTISYVQGRNMLIPTNGFAVIADDSSKFLNYYPSYSGLLLESSFSLLNTGEYLAIKNATFVIIDEVTFINQTGADNTNYTIELNNDNWEVSNTYLGTPGAPNSGWHPPLCIFRPQEHRLGSLSI